MVESSVNFQAACPRQFTSWLRRQEVPAQISNGKVLFVAKVQSVGYAVYDVQPGAGAGSGSAGIAGIAGLLFEISTTA